MNKDLMLAVLAMEAYAETPRNLGTAVALDVARPTGFEEVGFSAFAYQWHGETIISFRGTNDNFADPWNGYGTFFGESSTQSELAASGLKRQISSRRQICHILNCVEFFRSVSRP